MARRSEDHDWQPPTPRDYANGPHSDHADCGRCQHRATLDLVQLAAGSHALTPLIHLRLNARTAEAQCSASPLSMSVLTSPWLRPDASVSNRRHQVGAALPAPADSASWAIRQNVAILGATSLQHRIVI
jgi:hypothetical protein